MNKGICVKSSPDFYQIPSQPINKNRSPSYLFTYFMSGMQVIACLWKGNPGAFLWQKSPIERVKFSPFTLPAMICTPAFSILNLSIGFSGLWSSERASTLNFLHKAALESPAFAHMTLSLVIATTIAVQPDCKSCYDTLLILVTCFLYSINYLIAGFIFIIN